MNGVYDDPDQALLNDFLRSRNREIIGLWFKEGEKQTEIALILQEFFMAVPIVVISQLDFFRRNCADATHRNPLSFNTITLPALELEYEDPDHLNRRLHGFIEGEDNILFFLQEFKKYPLRKK
jgi:hypothetical protein